MGLLVFCFRIVEVDALNMSVWTQEQSSFTGSNPHVKPVRKVCGVYKMVTLAELCVC